MEKGEPFCCWWECRLMQPLWKAVWRYLKKLKMDLPFEPVIPLLGIYPKEPKTLIWKNISTTMFIAALFTAKIWKQPKCPSVDEWIKQLWLFLIEQDHERSPRVCLLEASKRELQESSGTWSWTQESGFAYEYALWFRGSPIVFFLHFQLNCHYKHLSPLGHHNHPCIYKWN